MRMVGFHAFLLILCPVMLLQTGCGSDDGSNITSDQELVVFAAASLSDGFSELGHQFEADHPGVKIILNVAGSQQLAHQLSQGAPADVFASANEQQMAAVVDAGRVEPGSQQIFAQNRLLVIYPRQNPAGFSSLADLAQPDQSTLIAAPEVPAGFYTRSFLELAAQDPDFGPEYSQAVLDNVVSYEENVRAVLSKVRLGEADVGIVYESDVWGDVTAELGMLQIPERLNVTASYPIAMIDNAEESELGQDFIAFVLSRRGQEILADYGFIPVSPAK